MKLGTGDMEFRYRTKGVCSREFIFDIDDNNIIKKLDVIGGCHGNLQGIAKLLEGMRVQEVIARLDGVRCGFKETSCPDQIAQALKQYLKEHQ